MNYDAVYCDYLVILGKSVGYDSGLAGGDARSFADGLRRGLKFVTVGPRASMAVSYTHLAVYKRQVGEVCVI